METPKFSILIHYSEIGLKKNNRSYFEKIFINNISNHIRDLNHKRIRLISARVFIENINPNDWDTFKVRLGNVMGLSSAVLMVESTSDFDSIRDASNFILDNVKFTSFRVTTRRHDKSFKKTSIDVNIELGSIIQKSTQAKVQLSDADLNLIIEILKDKSYIGYQRIIGYGGLPSKSQEEVISLLSSGIDSPVSSFEMIKRGVNVNFLHFHSYPATSKQSIDNVKELVNVLTTYQLKSNLFCIPLLEIQEKIMKEIPEKFWIIFFRRAMLKITNILAAKLNSIAVITGDNIGQVASQTLSNIRAISEASELPIIRPLAGMNKVDIINRAKDIGTYDISIKPYQDCCSYFVPIHPETKAKFNEVLDLARKLDLKKEYEKAIDQIEQIKIKFLKD
jgi:thiamine biosynthesis protein ThiI